MPELSRVLTQEDLARHERTNQLDLTEYLAIISSIQSDGGLGGLVTLGEDEKQRTEKRRLSMAAKQHGLNLTWRKAEPGQLRFVLSPPGETTPGGRKSRKQAAPAKPSRRAR